MSNQKNENQTHTNQRLTWMPAIATALSMTSCYGTLIAISLLSVAGISIKLNDTAWATTIVVFAVLAIVAIAIRNFKNNNFGPIILASLGAGLVTYAMFISYSVSVEIIGFALLLLATIWDFLAKRTPQLSAS